VEEVQDLLLQRGELGLEGLHEQRHVFGDVLAAAMRDADDPEVVAKVILAAATDQKPKLRYTAGSTAGRVSALRRVVPSRAFDKQIRKLNRLAG